MENMKLVLQVSKSFNYSYLAALKFRLFTFSSHYSSLSTLSSKTLEIEFGVQIVVNDPGAYQTSFTKVHIHVGISHVSFVHQFGDPS